MMQVLPSNRNNVKTRGYIKTAKTENLLGKREKLRKNELFYSDRKFFIAKSREFSRFLCRNTPLDIHPLENVKSHIENDHLLALGH